MGEDLKLSVFNKVVKDACKQISNAVGKNVKTDNIDICLCRGYITLYYENDDYVVNVEISENGDEMFINSFEVEEL